MSAPAYFTLSNLIDYRWRVIYAGCDWMDGLTLEEAKRMVQILRSGDGHEVTA